MHAMSDGFWFFILATSLVGLTYAVWCAYWVMARPLDDGPLQPPYRAIRDGAGAFIRTQYGVIALVGLGIGLLLYWIWGPLMALGFAIGALFSAVSGIAGMMVSVQANVRTAHAAQTGVSEALNVALRSGSVTGFLVGGLVLLAVGGFYYFLTGSGSVDLTPMTGLGFGASLVSIFARLGGGIFTKAADVGADLSGKIEQGIPEDDPRNPAVIADNVGDNVGDCAGMAADVFESYAVTLVAAILVAAWSMPDDQIARIYPFAIGAAGMLASLIGIQFARLTSSGRVLTALTRGLIIAILIAVAGFYLVDIWLVPNSGRFADHSLFATALTGLAVGLGMVLTTSYQTGIRYRPVHAIAEASTSGHATNIITGLAVGMKATVVPTLAIATGIVAAYALAGVYGIAVATCALLAMSPVVISVDAFGPVTDNAGGIAEMAGLPESVRDVTDALDAAGNTTKALTKVFAIGSAGLAALALFVVFKLEVLKYGGACSFSLDNPYVLAGLLVGSLLPFVFSGFALDAVGLAASKIVQEVRRQFETMPGILKGEVRPDYVRAVTLLTRASIRGMLAPAALPLVVVLVICLIWVPIAPKGTGAELMGGILIGALGSGLLLALFMAMGGAAWDNAKKYIEQGHFGGKGSEAHAAAVTGDTVGDPFKDTAGPAINPLLKVLSMLAILVAPFIV